MPVIVRRKAEGDTIATQWQKPHGLMGQFALWRMNLTHGKLTDWGLSQAQVGATDTVLDVGCGGGRTLGKLAALASRGKAVGIDFSDASIALSRRTNAKAIAEGRVEVQQASVSSLPFPDGAFDLVTAVETHFWWSNLEADLKEVVRVLKPGGRLLIIAEVYKGGNNRASELLTKHAERIGIRMLTAEEHRELLAGAGLAEVEITEEKQRGWIVSKGRKR